MFPSVPIGLPGLAVFATGFLAGTILLIAARSRRDVETGSRRDRTSLAGILIQALGFAIVGFGPILVLLDPLGGAALAEAATIAVLMVTSIGLFGWAARTMGRDWSLRARTRADHRLVRDGPFRFVRHPIYTALLLYLIAMAIAFGHSWHLLAALPVFAVGTMIRVRSEEALLRTMFGDEHEAWAAQVKRFVPGLF